MGKKVVLLPQALGPFESFFNRKAMKSVVHNVDMIFARDRVSLDHLLGVSNEREKICMAPDFTNLIEGVVPDYFESDVLEVCVVPNYRMIDKTDGEVSQAYFDFLVKCVRFFSANGMTPFLLVHEGARDVALAKKISHEFDDDLKIIYEDDPLVLKGIIGESKVVVASRYHALISALSQGVPAISTSWSHKYEMLFDDYGISDYVLNVLSDEKILYNTLNRLINTECRETIASTLRLRSEEIKKESRGMWEKVHEIIAG